MLIWRRPEPESGGLYAYKVYGSFSDVTGDDFLQAQIDVDYRKQWDPTAQELEIIETDPTSESSVNNSTDIIHWEMIWPVSNMIVFVLLLQYKSLLYFIINRSSYMLRRNYFQIEIMCINDVGSWTKKRGL